MNRRRAIKVGLRPYLYNFGRLWRAMEVLWHMRRGCCHDCPEGLDDESGGLCPNRKGCQALDSVQRHVGRERLANTDPMAATVCL